MNLLQATLLGVVEGVTEFLPVSSTGHLTVAERLLGLQVDDPVVTGFTAVVQFGAVLAVLVFFRGDLTQLLRGAGSLLRRLPAPRGAQRGSAGCPQQWSPAERAALQVGLGSLPILLVGFVARDVITGSLRSLWVVALALVLFSPVMLLADRSADRRTPSSASDDADPVSFPAVLSIGAAQCLALVPGVSRSGATISAGLLLGLDRAQATRMSFLLSLPALVAATAVEAPAAVAGSAGIAPVALGVAVAFVVAYLCIGWLLRQVTRHGMGVFVGYRITAGLVLLGVLVTGGLTAT